MGVSGPCAEPQGAPSGEEALRQCPASGGLRVGSYRASGGLKFGVEVSGFGFRV